MNDARNAGVFLEYAFRSFLVAKIHILKGGAYTRDLFNSVDHFHLGVGQVVYNYHVVTSLNELYTRVGTYKTCSSSNKNCLFHNDNIAVE